jgi:hypothetical protein
MANVPAKHDDLVSVGRTVGIYLAHRGSSFHDEEQDRHSAVQWHWIELVTTPRYAFGAARRSDGARSWVPGRGSVVPQLVSVLAAVLVLALALGPLGGGAGATSPVAATGPERVNTAPTPIIAATSTAPLIAAGDIHPITVGKPTRPTRTVVTPPQPAPFGPAGAIGELGIPALVLTAYHRAADRLAKEDPTCHLPWWLLAGIGHTESGHAEGGRLYADGTTRGRILGPVLNGGIAGDAVITDTDHGRYDGDTRYDRAVGPMQFIPSTWAFAGADGNNDGKKDPNNIFDATLAAGRYLCNYHRDLSKPAGLTAAILSYNNSQPYLATVLAWGEAYRDGAIGIDGSILPVAPDVTKVRPPLSSRPPRVRPVVLPSKTPAKPKPTPSCTASTSSTTPAAPSSGSSSPTVSPSVATSASAAAVVASQATRAGVSASGSNTSVSAAAVSSSSASTTADPSASASVTPSPSC